MKRLIFSLIFCFFAVLPLFAQTAEDQLGPEISIPEYKQDIGETLFRRDTTYIYKFPFQNIGTDPLTIIQVKAGCPCVSVSYPEDPVPAGQVDTIVVRFTPTRAGRFTQRVAVISNAKKGSLKQLYAKATLLKSSVDNK
ncbi:MAG: DUF1573 domain-containing protein [Candidatus Methanomethylophilaceae archaeon]|nr:DUF1573 domain-containing protein [Candidatus Methanomethylophilaceae archaeon]